MENAPIDGLESLEKHLQVLVQKPDTPFDAKLFDDVELQLTRKWMAFLLSARWNNIICLFVRMVSCRQLICQE